MDLASGVHSIKDVAIRNAKSPVDLDTLRNRLQQTDKSLGLSVAFPEFEMRTFYKNYFMLLNNAKKEKFLPRWDYRPMYCSWDILKSEVYWPLIMYMNNVMVMEEFTGFDTILVPDMNSILELTKNRGIDRRLVPYEDNDPENFKALKYYKSYDTITFDYNNVVGEINRLAQEVTPTITTTVEQREYLFNLDSSSISNKYFDISDIPDNPKSLTILYNDYTLALRYGYDYIIISDDDDKIKRVSWDITIINEALNLNLNENTGIRKVIKETDTMLVRYTYTTYSS